MAVGRTRRTIRGNKEDSGKNDCKGSWEQQESKKRMDDKEWEEETKEQKLQRHSGQESREWNIVRKRVVLLLFHCRWWSKERHVCLDMKTICVSHTSLGRKDNGLSIIVSICSRLLIAVSLSLSSLSLFLLFFLQMIQTSSCSCEETADQETGSRSETQSGNKRRTIHERTPEMTAKSRRE